MTDSYINPGKFFLKKWTKQDKIPYQLLLMADPSISRIEGYLSFCDLFLLMDNDNCLGCCALRRQNDESAEIMNIAVDPSYRRLGLGSRMLEHATKTSRENGVKRLIIGTGNSSTDQIRLYFRHGFRISEIKKNYFLLNYVDPITENGIPCRDMIVLTKEL